MTTYTNNRQLPRSDRVVAAELAANSDGKYTAAQIENAMRAGGNTKLGATETTGMVVPLTADTKASELYDTTGMMLSTAADKSWLVQKIDLKVDPSLAAYIQRNTGGSASPYNWSSTTLGVASAPAKSDLSNPFTPNASGCITAECAASIEPNRAPSEGQIRYFGGLQALGGAAQSVGGAKLVAGGAATCVETLGAGCVVALFGGFEMLAGWDNVNTGTKTGIDGRGYATTGGELLQRAGLSAGYAEMKSFNADYVVIEYKFCSSPLGKTVDGLQGSDNWIFGANTGRDRFLKSLEGDRAQYADFRNAYNAGRVEKWLVHTDPHGNVTVGILDKNGKFQPNAEAASKILGKK